MTDESKMSSRLLSSSERSKRKDNVKEIKVESTDTKKVEPPKK